MFVTNDKTRAADNPYNAVAAFIANYAAPPLDESMVLAGHTSNLTRPATGEDYAIVTPISEIMRGTPIEEYEKKGDAVLGVRVYIEQLIQIDFFSANHFDAKARAESLLMILRSSHGADFFSDFAIDCLYGENLRNLSGVIDSAQYVSRWSFELRLGFWKQLEVKQSYFTKVKPVIKEVDTSFKP